LPARGFWLVVAAAAAPVWAVVACSDPATDPAPAPTATQTATKAPTAPPCNGGGDSGVQFKADGGHYDPPDPVPPQYQVLTNPYPYDDAGLADIGWGVYEANCVRCHGATGHGDGVDADLYCPRPANLNLSNRLHPDQYLFWRIHDGGDLPGFHTAMPAFGGVLTDDEIWRVITTIRLRFLDF
jgi:mono/diheme cytochrome c family protein